MIKVGFLGAGNMAYALAAAIARGRQDVILVPYDTQADRIELFKRDFPRVEGAAHPRQTVEETRLCVAAVKPQVLPRALQDLGETRGLLVSIAAGVPLAKLQGYCPLARFIRVMPNTPALVGEMTGAFTPGLGVSAEDRELAAGLLQCAGPLIEVEESLMDGVTGLSGSGPAFFARLAQGFIDAGRELGLEESDARLLTLQTMKGTAALLLERGYSCEALISMVSSPGGTTLAGREILEASDAGEVIRRTVLRAAARSRELGGE
ncbi:MAG: pyrroline-5-carboxylate reductase [Spirochaetales bacterium]|jgi:pyrroline-5-carboxylate reductase|nr:pyrroline-5-carboxylate reductase [Spirochaetales bacterium]